MSQIKKSKNLSQWFEDRLAVSKFWKVMVSELIPKISTFYGRWVLFY